MEFGFALINKFGKIKVPVLVGFEMVFRSIIFPEFSLEIKRLVILNSVWKVCWKTSSKTKEMLCLAPLVIWVVVVPNFKGKEVKFWEKLDASQFPIKIVLLIDIRELE